MNRRFWRRRSARATAALVGLALLAACSSGPSGGSGPATTELSILTAFTKGTPEGAPFYSAIDRFTAQTGIKVNAVEGAEKVADLYETSVLAGQEPDIMVTNLVEKSTGWVDNGVAVPVDTYLDEWGLRSRVKPDALQEWRNAKGEVQGFPYSGFTWPVWYNTALLAKAGVTSPPTTTDELIAAAAKLRAAKIGPMAVGGSDWSGHKVFLQIIQQYLTPEGARTRFAKGGYCADPAAMKGIDLFVQLRDGGVFLDDSQGYTADLMNSAFYNGDAAIMAAGSWAFTNTPGPVAATTTLGGFPVPPGGTYTKPTVMQGGTATGMFISPKGAAKADAVKAFVQTMYDPATVADFVSRAGLVPALTTTGDTKASSPLLEQAVTQLPAHVDHVVMPDTAVPPDKADALIRATAAAYAPRTDSSSICRTLDAVYAS
jgi:multiple sugar transport system substrate-binding protein